MYQEEEQQKVTIYNKQDQIILCQIQPLKKTYSFPSQDAQQVQQAVYYHASIQTLLKHIHYKYKDQGLRYTLIHKLYTAKKDDFAYYVPQFVYIAVKKKCKPMRKLLIFRAQNDQSLRRLILWNVKAFTVLMKERDPQLKKYVQKLQQELVNTCKNINKFNHAQKCIAMLTTASLALKQLPTKQQQKQNLKQFIKKFNSQFLSDLQHNIIIPFRKQDDSKWNSDYVVRLVQDDCNCYPTRKRVPYRIMIQTIDSQELFTKKPDQSFFKLKKITIIESKKQDKQKNLFDQVSQKVQKLFSTQYNKEKIGNILSGKYPFVVDTQENNKITQLVKFAQAIQAQQKQKQKKKLQQKSLKKRLTRSIMKFGTMRNDPHQERQQKSVLGQSRMNKHDSNLQKFAKIYISTIPSSIRKSITITHNLNQTKKWAKQLEQSRKRWSSHRDSVQDDVRIYEQQNNIGVRNDNTGTVWGQLLSKKINKFKKSSYFQAFKSLKLHNVVVKGGDDLRQQIICMQLIYKMRDILKLANINVLIKPYEIIVLSQNSGLLQFVANSISLDGLKKQTNMDLPDFFKNTFETQQKYAKAKQNFVRSLVGSSILTYVLKLKDRHNGNILLDCDGNIIHIDFGFILGMSPGGINFQSSPFKLTEQYIDLMQGKQSKDYKLFCSLFCDAMSQIRKRFQQLCLVLDVMRQDSDLQCFQKFQMQVFRDRFKPTLSQQKFRQHCLALIEKSCMNARTVNYDTFQYYSNGIQP